MITAKSHLLITTLLLQLVGGQWDVAAALQTHKERKFDEATQQAGQQRVLVGFSAHQKAGLLEGLLQLLNFTANAGHGTPYTVVLFLGGGGPKLGMAVQEGLKAAGRPPIHIVHMDSPPTRYRSPMEVFRNTYMAQQHVMEYRLARASEYEHVWIIEQDVMFSGPWGRFFKQFEQSNADLIAHIRVNEAKYHWSQCTYCNSDDKKHMLTALLPVSRYSLRLHQAIKAALDTGATGHHELLTHAVAKRTGLRIEAFDVPKILGRNFCAGGCIWSKARYEAELALPAVTTSDGKTKQQFANRLYHPVKVGQTESEVCAWEKYSRWAIGGDCESRSLFFRGWNATDPHPFCEFDRAYDDFRPHNAPSEVVASFLVDHRRLKLSPGEDGAEIMGDGVRFAI